MINKLGLSLMVGASLGASYQATMNNATSLAGVLQNKLDKVGLKKKALGSVIHFNNRLNNLKETQKRLGGGSSRLNRIIETTKGKFNQASISASKLGINVNKVEQEYKQLTNQLKRTQRAQSVLNAKQRAGAKLASAKSLAFSAAASAYSLSIPIRQAIKFESVMADVRKVVNFDTPTQFKQMGSDILKLSSVIPLAASGLGDIVAAAGQAGIKKSELLRFAEDAAKMAVAFDMSGAAAGSAMTGLRSIFQLTQKDVVSLGDTFNNLSNNMDTTAVDLLNIANRAGATGKLIGLSGNQIGALGATFKVLKTQTEVAGTAMNAMFIKLATADKQGVKFESALKSIGLSAVDFKKAIKNDAQGALLQFFDAVKKSKDVVGTLSDLFGNQYADDVAKIVGGLDQYKRALILTNDASVRNLSISEKMRITGAKTADQLNKMTLSVGSMNAEYTARSKTTENSMILLGNQMTRLGITVGSVLLPPLNSLVSWLSSAISVVTRFAEKNQWLAKAIGIVAVGFTGLVAAGILVNATIWSLSGATLAYSAIAGKLATVIKIMSAAQVLLNAAMIANPIGVAITAIAALAAGLYALYQNFEPVRNAFNVLGSGIVSVFTWVWEKLKKFIGFVSSIASTIASVISGVSGFFSGSDKQIKLKQTKTSHLVSDMAQSGAAYQRAKASAVASEIVNQGAQNYGGGVSQINNTNYEINGNSDDVIEKIKQVQKQEAERTYGNLKGLGFAFSY